MVKNPHQASKKWRTNRKEEITIIVHSDQTEDEICTGIADQFAESAVSYPTNSNAGSNNWNAPSTLRPNWPTNMNVDPSPNAKEEQDEKPSLLPIYIGGTMAGVILVIGAVLGYHFVRYPNSKITTWFARFV